MSNAPLNPERKSLISKYITGPIEDMAGEIAGKIVAFPFKILDKAVNGVVTGVENAALAVIGFPVGKGK